MSELSLKCENNAILSKTVLKNCLFLLKYIFAVLGFRGNLEFPDFLQKNFYHINYCCCFCFQAKV